MHYNKYFKKKIEITIFIIDPANKPELVHIHYFI